MLFLKRGCVYNRNIYLNTFKLLKNTTRIDFHCNAEVFEYVIVMRATSNKALSDEIHTPKNFCGMNVSRLPGTTINTYSGMTENMFSLGQHRCSETTSLL